MDETRKDSIDSKFYYSLRNATGVKQKDEFSTMITHELKILLVPIIGYCKMFKTSMLGRIDPEQLEAIEIIEKNAKRLETLISDMLLDSKYGSISDEQRKRLKIIDSSTVGLVQKIHGGET